MNLKPFIGLAATAMILMGGAIGTPADILELVSGSVIENCFVRDEGTQITVWTSLDDVGGPPKVYPRSAVKGWKVQRAEAWDRKPNKPDLTISFIEITPKLAGLHGRVQYDKYGRPWIAGDSPLLVDIGERKFTDPEGAVRKLKLKYEPGEPLTLTAHVKNIGFADARPFGIEWLIDGRQVARDSYDQPLAEMGEATFTLKWDWQAGFHNVTVRIVADQPEIATINNEATDALWAFAFTFTVSRGRVDAWHQFRSAYGTFSFEDFYRWHVDIMNLLFERSIWPATPEGIKARVRLDRIVYADSVKDNTAQVDGQQLGPFAADGIRYDQGGWVWNDSNEELKTGVWVQTDHTWRNQTEWSLPHELGHQLGLVDWYALDYPGHENHVWPDNGEKVTHFMRYPVQMMHWHGPQPYGEADAAYLNATIDKPRGHFGDVYFANPRECFLHIVDINGQGLPEAKVEIFQRGVVVDPAGPIGTDHGVKYFSVVEDGDFYTPPISKDAVAVGVTDATGMFRLPNRPVKEVRTLNGFHRRDNPFGNMNVVGQRSLMLARVTKQDRVCYFWLEGHDFVTAWFRGHRDRHVMTVKTPYASVDSPPAPADVSVERVDGDHVRVSWARPRKLRERNYLDEPIGYRVYRRIGNDGIKDRPWFPVATVGPDQTRFTVDMRECPKDIYWFKPRTQRFGVTTIAASSVESELSEVLLEE